MSTGSGRNGWAAGFAFSIASQRNAQGRQCAQHQAKSRRRAFLADGHRLMNRPGPRLVDSLEVLIEILHPDAAAPRHRGTGWEPL